MGYAFISTLGNTSMMACLNKQGDPVKTSAMSKDFYLDRAPLIDVNEILTMKKEHVVNKLIHNIQLIDTEWSLQLQVFTVISRVFGRPVVDLFTSKNKKNYTR